eukprot:g21606.t1
MTRTQQKSTADLLARQKWMLDCSQQGVPGMALLFYPHTHPHLALLLASSSPSLHSPNKPSAGTLRSYFKFTSLVSYFLFCANYNTQIAMTRTQQKSTADLLARQKWMLDCSQQGPNLLIRHDIAIHVQECLVCYICYLFLVRQAA